MRRTQISLSEQDYQDAKAVAKRQGISLAEFFRRALRKALPPKGGEKPWMNYAGIISSGDEDSSRQIDEVVYGEDS